MVDTLDSDYMKLNRLRSIVMDFQRAAENRFDQDPEFEGQINKAMTDEDHDKIDALEAKHNSRSMNKPVSIGDVKKATNLMNMTAVQITDLSVEIMLRTIDISEIVKLLPESARNLEVANHFRSYNAPNLAFVCLG